MAFFKDITKMGKVFETSVEKQPDVLTLHNQKYVLLQQR